MRPRIGDTLDGYRFLGGDPGDEQAWQPMADYSPQPGDIVDGYRFGGGNPSDQAAWSEVSDSPAATQPASQPPAQPETPDTFGLPANVGAPGVVSSVAAPPPNTLGAEDFGPGLLQGASQFAPAMRSAMGGAQEYAGERGLDPYTSIKDRAQSRALDAFGGTDVPYQPEPASTQYDELLSPPGPAGPMPDFLRGAIDAIKPISDALGDISAGLQAIPKAPLGILRAADPKAYDQSLERIAAEGRAENRAAQIEIAQAREQMDSPGARLGFDTGLALVQMGPALAAGLGVGAATKNPGAATAVSLSMMGGQVGADSYAQYREQGLSEQAAAAAAKGQVAAEILTELLPVGIALKPGMPAFKRILATAFAEMPGEALSSVGSQVTDAMAVDGMTLNQAFDQVNWEDVVREGAIGGMVGGGMGAIAAPVHALQERAAENRALRDLESPEQDAALAGQAERAARQSLTPDPGLTPGAQGFQTGEPVTVEGLDGPAQYLRQHPTNPNLAVVADADGRERVAGLDLLTSLQGRGQGASGARPVSSGNTLAAELRARGATGGLLDRLSDLERQNAYTGAFRQAEADQASERAQQERLAYEAQAMGAGRERLDYLAGVARRNYPGLVSRMRGVEEAAQIQQQAAVESQYLDDGRVPNSAMSDALLRAFSTPTATEEPTNGQEVQGQRQAAEAPSGLLNQPPAEDFTPPSEIFTPTHETSDGTPVVETGEPNVYRAASGEEIIDPYTQPIADPAPAPSATAQPAAEVQPATPRPQTRSERAKEQYKKRMQVNIERDDLLDAIRKLGGIDTAIDSDLQGRLIHLDKAEGRPPGTPWLERPGKPGARSLDLMAEALQELGYLPTEQENETAFDRVAMLQDLLFQAENGQPIYHPGSTRWAEMYEEQAANALTATQEEDGFAPDSAEPVGQDDLPRMDPQQLADAYEGWAQTHGVPAMDQGEFEPDWDQQTRTIVELANAARARVGDDRVEAILDTQRPDGEIARDLARIISGEPNGQSSREGAGEIAPRPTAGPAARDDAAQQEAAAPAAGILNDDRFALTAQTQKEAPSTRPTADLFGSYSGQALAEQNARVTRKLEGDRSKDQPAPTLGGGLFAQAEDKAYQERQGDLLDQSAQESATSPTNGLPEPTQAQKEAGNYKKGRINVAGLDIAIENPDGSTRTGTDPGGKEWSVTYDGAHYGYFNRSTGKDGEQVDVYVKAGTAPDYDGLVFVVDQIDPETGNFDEHKVIIGASRPYQAEDIYRAGFSDGSGRDRMGAIQGMPMEAFKEWLGDAKRTRKPVAYKGDGYPNYRQAVSAYGHSSGSPHVPAGMHKADFLKAMGDARARAAEIAETPEQRQAMDQALADFRDEYLRRDKSVLNARAGVVSGFIAGGSKFNSKQAGRRGSASDRAQDDFSKWLRTAIDGPRQAALSARTDEQKARDRDAAAETDRKSRFAKAVGRLGGDLVSMNEPGMEPALFRKGALKALEEAHELDPAATVKALRKIDGMLKDQGGAVKAAGPRSQLGKRIAELLELAEPAPAAPVEAEAPSIDPAEAETPADTLAAAGFNRVDDYNWAQSFNSEAGDKRWQFNVIQYNGDNGLAYRVKQSVTFTGGITGAPTQRIGDFDSAGEAVRAVQNRVSILPVRKDEATAESPQPQPEAAPAVVNESLITEPTNPLAAHQSAIARLNDGDLTADELRAAWAAFKASRDAIQAEVSKMTKPAIFKAYPGLQWRYKNEKKARVVDALLDAFDMQFVLDGGVQYNPFEKGGKLNAIEAKVAGYTDSDIAKHAESVAQSRADRAERLEAMKKAITDPQTYEEFRQFIEMRGEDALSAEQRIQWDELQAERIQGRRQEKVAQKATVAAVDVPDDLGMSITETKHTRDGYDLFVVRLSDRVDRDTYKDLLGKAKQLGGWYSKFRGNGAVPGFQFKAREAAEKFMALREGDQSRAEDIEAKEAEQVERKTSRLARAAERLREAAEEKLGQDRRTNTARQARMASGAEADARADLQLAETMQNLADAIASGDAKHLGGISAKTHIEQLDSALREARQARQKAQGMSYSQTEKEKGSAYTNDDIEHARMPAPMLWKADMLSLGVKLSGKPGAKMLARKLANLARTMAEDTYLEFTSPGEIQTVREIIAKAEERDFPWYLRDRLKSRDRLVRAGIESDAQLRAALREYLQYRGGARKADPIKELERKLAGNANVGVDFFPTPPAQADYIVGMADIEPGMSVLEPSAGNGHLADAVRALGVEPDVIELSSTLREILEAKGFNLVGQDFMGFTAADRSYTYGDVFRAPDGRIGIMRGSNRERVKLVNEAGEMLGRYNMDDLTGIEKRGTDAGYDRIVMNPPFSNRMDAEHVQRAYGLLKPGGRLVSIMGEGVFFGSDKKATEFRDWLESVGGVAEKLPEGFFQDRANIRTTGVNSRVVVIDKPEGVTFSVSAQSQGAVDSPVSPTRVRRLVSRTREAWPGAPRIEVRDTLADMPDHIRRSAEARGLNPNAAWDGSTGTVYLIANRFGSLERVQRTLAHELIGHASSEEVMSEFPGGIDGVFAEINALALAGQLGTIPREIRGRWGYKPGARNFAAEVLPVMAERRARELTKGARDLLNRIFVAVRNWLRGVGFNIPWSRAELREILRRAESRLRTAKAAANEFGPAIGETQFASETQHKVPGWFGDSATLSDPEFPSNVQAWETAYAGTAQNAPAKISGYREPFPEGSPGLNYFGGIFASGAKDVALSHGNGRLLKFWYDPDVYMDHDDLRSALLYEDGGLDLLREIVKQKLHENIDGDELSDLADFVAQDKRLLDPYDPGEFISGNDRLGDILGYGDEGEMDWALQGLAGEVARRMGYSVLSLPDEHGFSLLVLGGKGVIWRQHDPEAMDEQQSDVQFDADQPDTIEVDGVQRPTTNSEGRPIHPTEDGIRNFWRWFGDSKVVDEQGRPLVVYHGSWSVDGSAIERFDAGRKGSATGAASAREGFFFSRESSNAEEFARVAGRRVNDGGPVTYPVFLSIQNPYVTDASAIEDGDGSMYAVIRQAKAAGHDGVIVQDAADTPRQKTVSASGFVFHDMDPNGTFLAEIFPSYLAGDLSASAVAEEIKDAISFAEEDAASGDVYAERELAMWREVGRLWSDDPSQFQWDRGARATVYAAFDPGQIKSAIGNAGTFNPTDDRIQFSARGPSDRGSDDLYERLGLGKRRSKLARFIDEVRAGGIREWRQHLGDLLAQGLPDRFHGIKAAQRDADWQGPIEQDGYVAARLSTGISSIVSATLQHGTPQWNADRSILEQIPGSKGLLDILAPVRDEMNDWLAWQAAKRADKLEAQGRENNLTRAQIDEGLALANGRRKKFGDVAREYGEFMDRILDIAEQAGLIKGATRALWGSSIDYIPFYRMTGEDFTQGPRGRRGLSHQQSGVRMLKGGESATSDLLENIMMNVTHLLDASIKNNAIDKTLRNLEGTDFVEPEPMAFAREMIPRGQIKKYLKESPWFSMWTQFYGADLKDLPSEMWQGLEKMWAMKAPKDPDVVRVMRNGQAEYFRVADPLLLRALTQVDAAAWGGPVALARKFKRVLTAGVTADPAFMARNFVRDAVHAWTINEDHFKIGIDSVRGALKTFRGTGGAVDMMFAGGSFLGGYINGNDPEGLATATRRALRSKGFRAASISEFMSTVVDTPAKYWDKYREWGDNIENANREAVYEAAIKAGKSRTQAAFEAKDLMDYSMGGSWPVYQIMADVLPFFNARVQGLYKLGRAGAVPLPGMARASVVMRGSLIAMASLALLAVNEDDDRYQELEDWDRDTYWHFFGPDGMHIRVPKPFEIGVIYGTVPERIGMNMLDHDTTRETFKAFAWNLKETFAIDPWPQMLRPGVELATNRDSFTKRPIENIGDLRKLPHARFDENTSATMRVLGEYVSDPTGLSPKQLEHIWRGYLGQLGAYALSASDLAVRAMEGAPVRPSTRIDDVPVIKSFVRAEPARGSRYRTQLYDWHQEAEEVYMTIQAHRKAGRIDQARELWEGNQETVAAYKPLKRAVDSLSTIRERMDRIYRSETMTRREKREKLDELLAQRNQISRQVVDQMGDFMR